MNATSARFLGQFGKFLIAFPASKDQPRSLVAQSAIERIEAVVQPPARGGPHPAMLRCFVVQDIDRDDRPALYRSGQRRLVGKPEIPAKPEDGWRGHFG